MHVPIILLSSSLATIRCALNGKVPNYRLFVFVRHDEGYGARNGCCLAALLKICVSIRSHSVPASHIALHKRSGSTRWLGIAGI